MAYTLTVRAGYVFQTDGSEGVLSYTKLNAILGSAVFSLEGTLTASSLGDGSVTGPKIAAGAIDDVTKFVAGVITLSVVNADYRWASLVAASRNLIVKNNAAAPNNKLDVAADEVVLKNAAGGAYLASAVSTNVDLTASGAGGLDTGSEAASTWYYLWLIYNGTTLSTLLSISSTAPTLPGGYTHKALLGAVRNDGSSNLVKMWQNDRRVCQVDTNIFTAKAASVADTYQLLSGADLTALQSAVPPIAKTVSGIAGSSTSSGCWITIAGDSNGVGQNTVIIANSTATFNSFFTAGRFDVPLMTSQNFYWKAVNTTANNRIDVTGYTI